MAKKTQQTKSDKSAWIDPFHRFKSLKDTDYHKGFIKRSYSRIRQADRALAANLAKMPLFEAREYASPHVKKRVLSLNARCIDQARTKLEWWKNVRDGRLMPVMSFLKSGHSFLEWVPTMVGDGAETVLIDNGLVFVSPVIPISQFHAFCRDWKIVRFKSHEDGWQCWAIEEDRYPKGKAK